MNPKMPHPHVLRINKKTVRTGTTVIVTVHYKNCSVHVNPFAFDKDSAPDDDYVDIHLKENQKHPFHLVDPSPWPFVSACGSLALTFGGVLYMHNFAGGSFLLLTGIVTILFVMYCWFKDIIREGTYEGQHTKTVQVGLRWGMLLCAKLGLQLKKILLNRRQTLLRCFATCFKHRLKTIYFTFCWSLFRPFTTHRITKLAFKSCDLWIKIYSILPFSKRRKRASTIKVIFFKIAYFLVQRAIGYRCGFAKITRRFNVFKNFQVGIFEKKKKQISIRFLSSESIILESMRTGNVLASLEKLNKNNMYVNSHLIHLISDKRVLVFAYKRIKKSSCCREVKKATPFKFEIKWLKKISRDLCKGTFRFYPKENLFILNRVSKNPRSLLISFYSDRIILLSIKLILECLFKSSFFARLYHKGCHAVLKKITKIFGNVSWIIESDLSKSFNLNVFMILFKKRITCEKTFLLVKTLFTAGLINLNAPIKKKFVTSIETSFNFLFFNIYFQEFDSFMLGLNKPFPVWEGRKKTKFDYRYLVKVIQTAKNSIFRKRVFKKLSNTFFLGHIFRKFVFVRYFNAFLVGGFGNFIDALRLKLVLQGFLNELLELDLAEHHITIVRSKEQFCFLSTVISIKSCFQDSELFSRYVNKSSFHSRTTFMGFLYLPMSSLMILLYNYGFINRQHLQYKPVAFRKLISMTHADILGFYNIISFYFMKYYSFAANYRQLGTIIKYYLFFSCLLTLSLKYKLVVKSKVLDLFGCSLTCPKTGKEFLFTKKF